MANPLATESGSDARRRPFAFAGTVTVWDPISRYLEIGLRTFQVATGVPVAGLTAGVNVSLTGYVERSTNPASPARWVVTHFSLG